MTYLPSQNGPEGTAFPTTSLSDRGLSAIASSTASAVTTHTTNRVSVGSTIASTESNLNLTLTENSGTASIYAMAAIIYRIIAT